MRYLTHQALTLGRRCEILLLLQAGEVEAARTLLVNTYGAAGWRGRVPAGHEDALGIGADAAVSSLSVNLVAPTGERKKAA